MCIDPASMAAIGTMVSLAGTVVGAAGAQAQADARADAAEYRQKQAIILAEDAEKRGVQKEEAQRRKTSALLGRQRAIQGAAGLDLSYGSPLNILADTAQLGELDAKVIRGNAAREAESQYATADLAGMEADASRTAGKYEAFGTVLGGISSVATKWSSLSLSSANGGRDPWNGLRAA